MNRRKLIAITGAGGAVGTAIRPLLQARYDLALLDRTTIAATSDRERVHAGDIGDPDALHSAFDGADAIIHLAGCTTEANFKEQVAGNIEGAWSVYETARDMGIERVIYASTHHVVGHYPRYRKLGTDAALRPDSRYGLTKGFGEQAGSLFADQFGLRVLAIRIGFLGERPTDRRRLSIWTSARDLVQLMAIGIEHPALRYAIVYGVSNNVRGFFDNVAAFRLGYRPEDSADTFVEEIMASTPFENPYAVGSRVIGGSMADAGFCGDLRRIDEW